MRKSYNFPCNIANTLDIIGDRWTLLIVRDLLFSHSKFNEIKESLKGISPNILSDRLQTLEREGIVKSTLYSKHPPRFEYELTEKGKELRHILNAIAIWGNKHLPNKYYEVAGSCGHEVEMSYYCPTCDAYTEEVKYQSKRE